ncbi:MAG: DHH family phosphoesterase [Acidobacteriaceae bacterium]
MIPEAIDASIKEFGKANNILIVIPPKSSGDTLSSALALCSFLKKMDKEVEVVCPTEPESKYDFLPGFDLVKTNVSATNNLVIEVSTAKTELEELSYDKEPQKLVVYLKPKSGNFTEQDVSIKSADLPFDLIVTVGIGSLEALGEFHSKNAEVFFRLPIVNIDFRGSNESFGTFNLVDLGATSCSEVVLGLINRFEKNLLDRPIATALLAGIIIETNSFQHTRTNPQTFLRASELISSGADQQEIVTRLYRTKSLNFLKLWGRALARIKQEPLIGLVYTMITQSDFIKSQATAQEIEQIIPEMGIQLKLARILLLMVESSPNQTLVYCQLPSVIDPQLLFGGFSPEMVGPQVVKFLIESPLIQAEELLIPSLITEVTRLNA